MNRVRVLFTGFMLLALHCIAQPHTVQDRLYYSCKVWGFVKYFHSRVNTCEVNWDSVLTRYLPDIRNAASDSEFNDALDSMLAAAGPMALSTSFFPDTLSPDLKRNRDFNWITAPLLRSDVQARLDTIKNNFRPGTNCNVYNNTYTTPYIGQLVFPNDSVELNINTSIDFPGVDHRLLMLFKYWNIVRYFNPYNYVLDQPWDSTLYRYCPQVASAPDAASLYLLYLKITGTLNDAHATTLTYSSQYFKPPGFYQPYVRLNYVDSAYMVIQTMVPGIRRGDVIMSVDGLTPAQWEDSLRPYFSHGNISVFHRLMCENMLGRTTDMTPENFVISDTSGTIHSVSVTCHPLLDQLSFFNAYFYPADSLANITWTTLPCDIGYVNMGNLNRTGVDSMYADLGGKSAIIFDLRNYPNETFMDLAQRLYPGQIQFANNLLPDVTYPGTFYRAPYYLGVSGNPTPYTGQVIVLMNEITESQAEFTCMVLKAMPGSILVGSQTTGADGNVSYWRLSQDLNTGLSTVGIFYPNGDSTQRIGIVPDSMVRPTRHGIAIYRDEVLEKAISIAGCNLAVPQAHHPGIAIVFPNPASTQLTIFIPASTNNEVKLELTDVSGRIIREACISVPPAQLKIQWDVSGVAAGLYILKATSDSWNSNTKIEIR